MKKFLNIAEFFLFTYPAGLCIGIVFELLRRLKMVEVRGWGNFPWGRTKLLVVSNHPSLLDPLLLYGLFFYQYASQPLKYGPWTVVDSKTYFAGWKRIFHPFVRAKLIELDRTDRKSARQSLVKCLRMLADGAIVFLFPEGGRTFRGTEWLTSLLGKRIRPLKEGIKAFAKVEGVLTLPIWVEWCGRFHVILVIGEPMSCEDTPIEEVVEKVQDTFLELADQAG